MKQVLVSRRQPIQGNPSFTPRSALATKKWNYKAFFKVPQASLIEASTSTIPPTTTTTETTTTETKDVDKIIVFEDNSKTPIIDPYSLGGLMYGAQCMLTQGQGKFRRAFIEGNHGPVKMEVYQEELTVEGTIPVELEGAYMRNGPNPAQPVVASYHWFEGDGMIHTCNISNGKASYSNRYVETKRLQQEREMGPLFGRIGDLKGVLGVTVAMLEVLKSNLGVIDISNGEDAGYANTSVVSFGGKVMALSEGDLPYEVKVTQDGRMETIGRMQVGDKGQWGKTFTAHPKFDSDTGLLHIFGYNVQKAPYLEYGQLDPKGKLIKSMHIKVDYPTMFHDFAITKSKAIFLHMPLCFDPEGMVTRPDGMPIVFKPELPSRIGVLPFMAKDDSSITWFELPSFFVFHVANAYEHGEDGRFITINCCLSESMDINSEVMTPLISARMTAIDLDLKDGSWSLRRLSDAFVDFPVVHPALVAKPSKFAWTATFSPGSKPGAFQGIAKMDLSDSSGADACIAEIAYPTGTFGGEAYFVPKNDDPAACLDHDDGYLIVYVHEEASITSYLHIYDAKKMSPKPLARVKLPQRVPYGFHGSFIKKSLSTL